MEKDRAQFKKYNADYENDPLKASEKALEALGSTPEWREHWDQFLEQMVYEKKKPSFDEAYSNLWGISENTIRSIKAQEVSDLPVA